MRRIKVVHAQKQADTSGELIAHDRTLPIPIGASEQDAGRRATRADHDPPFGPAVVGQRGHIFDELELQHVHEERNGRIVFTDHEGDEGQVRCHKPGSGSHTVNEKVLPD